MKPYQEILIQECNEPLTAIAQAQFAFENPHPYVKLGAPYGEKSPYFLRQGVLERLIVAQQTLQSQLADWQMQIFDAYRPIAVQQFMVDYTFAEQVKVQGQSSEYLTDTERHQILQQVYQFWAAPSCDPLTPPPHSTGAAIDLTLVDASGQIVDMGSAIDEISPRSHPNYFAQANQSEWQNSVSAETATYFHQNRQILMNAMITAGFRQHPNEWWHFSYGDQLWAWLINQEMPELGQIAFYGAAA
jgi:zinc D-Ala-D-Ala dipeptidase